MKKLNVAILFGGRSEEHDVSIKSAVEIAGHMDLAKYEPIYIWITRDGAWKLCDQPCMDLEKISFPSAVLSPDKGVHGLIVLEGGQCRILHIDVVFPVLHGKMGEDGAIQGLLELSGIPYVGCGIAASAVCMDKSLTYLIARNAGIATPEFHILRMENGAGGGFAEKLAVRYPVFVKPARSGSSFGVTKVCDGEGLCAAVEEAARYDNKILVEEEVPGTEVGCAVLGDEEGVLVGEVDQITLSHGIFRIHQEAAPEQGSENAVFFVPAKIPEEKRQQVQETAVGLYRELGCTGLARVDFFLREDGRIVLNEVNTMPGFTVYSRYPRMMAAAGIGLGEIIDRCIALALKQ